MLFTEVDLYKHQIKNKQNYKQQKKSPLISQTAQTDHLNLKAVCVDTDDLWLHSVPVATEEPGCPPVAVALGQQHIEHWIDTGVQVLEHRANEVERIPI